MPMMRNTVLIGMATILLCASLLFIFRCKDGERVCVPQKDEPDCTELRKEQLTLEKKVQDMKEYQKVLENEVERLHSDMQNKQSSPGTGTQSSSDCDAWLKSCHTHCTRTATGPIPKHVHFISLNRPFSFVEWLAVITSKKKIKPDKITVYTDGQQDSCWWRRALPYIEHQLVHLLPGSNVLNGVKITDWAHKSDYLRESILYHHGGIYMDTDSLALNSFDPLLSNQVVLAIQCDNATAIGVILAQKHNCLICEYARRSCQMFKGQWATHTVYTMNALAKEVNKEKEGLVVLPFRKGFYPMCYNSKGLHSLFKGDLSTAPQYNKSDIYAVHLFSNRAKHMFGSTINNFDWIQNSKSLVAITIRESLPPDFSKQHFNTQECANLQLID